MRYGPNDKFWLVIDPTPRSALADILCEASLRRLLDQFRGGLSMAENPTMFSEYEEAREEAERRLAGMRAARGANDTRT